MSVNVEMTKLAPDSWDGLSMCEPVLIDGYYQISLPGEIAWIANEVNVNGKTGINAVLNKDINLSDFEWTPIGSPSKPYTGIFNGNEKMCIRDSYKSICLRSFYIFIKFRFFFTLSRYKSVKAEFGEIKSADGQS